MEILYTTCAGLDVHKKTVKVCLLAQTSSIQPHKEFRTYFTTTEELLKLSEWLKEQGCTHIAFEATEVYWRPIYNLLEGDFEILVVNAHHIKTVPGRKTDVWATRSICNLGLRPAELSGWGGLLQKRRYIFMQRTQNSDPTAANTRWERSGTALALLIIAGIVLYVILDVIAQLLPPHYKPISQAESDLAVGPYGFVMTVNFVLRGLLSLALVWALTRAVTKQGLSRPGLALLGIWGVGALVLAAFPTDLAGATPTLHGIIHLIVATLAFICGAIGELLLSLRFARDERWRALRAPGVVMAVLAIVVCLVLFTAAFPHALGLVERIFIGLVLLWMLVAAIHLRSLSARM